jgi:hypothetical protein
MRSNRPDLGLLVPTAPRGTRLRWRARRQWTLPDSSLGGEPRRGDELFTAAPPAADSVLEPLLG